MYDWHLAPGAFLCLVPPWEWLHLAEPDRGIFPGCVRRMLVTPLRWPWLALHEQFEPARQFVDRQLSGPCRYWTHRHLFADQHLEDEVEFELPLAPLSNGVMPFLKSQFERMFLYRHRVTAQSVSRPPVAPLKIAVTGAGGLLGKRLVPFLTTAGHEVVRLVRRRPSGPSEVFWNPGLPPKAGRLSELEGLDAVIHLAGKGVLEGDFGSAHREQIRTSRVEATANLCASLQSLQRPPRVFLSASGSGFYGQEGGGEYDETSPAGCDFLARVCVDWEAASQILEARRVLLRIGPVLHLAGSSLPFLYYSSLLAPWSWRFGDGRQPLSWIALDDVLGIIYTALTDERWSGPFNLTAPEPATLGECSRQVGRLLGRSCQVSLPLALVRAAVGRRAPLFLGGTRVLPRRALELGYRFLYPDLAACLRHSLGRFGPQDQPEGWAFDWA